MEDPAVFFSILHDPKQPINNVYNWFSGMIGTTKKPTGLVFNQDLQCCIFTVSLAFDPKPEFTLGTTAGPVAGVGVSMCCGARTVCVDASVTISVPTSFASKTLGTSSCGFIAF